MLNSILANLIAGLGLFFGGLRMVDANLRQATGRQLRTIIGQLTRSAWIAGPVGLVTGALVQSSSGIVFILVSLVASGLTTVRRVLPISIELMKVGAEPLKNQPWLLSLLNGNGQSYILALASSAIFSFVTQSADEQEDLSKPQFQHDLVNQQLGPDETERLTKLQNRLSLIVYLEDSLKALTAATESVALDGHPACSSA
jgi:hypothetical protein